MIYLFLYILIGIVITCLMIYDDGYLRISEIPVLLACTTIWPYTSFLLIMEYLDDKYDDVIWRRKDKQ